jgi:hypothetical protein
MNPRRLFYFVLIAIIMLSVRLAAYEPLGRSVSTYDTQAFVTSSQIPFWSQNFFTSDRPAAISLFYKLLVPKGGYQLTYFSSPAEDQQQPLQDQPSFSAVTLSQSLLTMAAWLLLAFVVYKAIKNTALAAIAAILIFLFAFTPPAAEWDYVLLSEPLSLTLFVFLLAISIELAKRPKSEWKKPSRMMVGLIAAWSTILTIWVFARDTNAYLLLTFIGFLAIFLLISWFKRAKTTIPRRTLLITLVLSVLLFGLQSVTSQASGRWINPFFNNMLHRVFPYPEHLVFFENKGMPVTAEVLSLRDSPGNEDKFSQIDYLMNWVKLNGARTYIEFLMSDPSGTWDVFVHGVRTAFDENRQPFFIADPDVTPDGLVYLGNLLHPNSTSVIWVVAVELAIFAYVVLRSTQADKLGPVVLLTVFFLGELLMLFVSIEGDALGIVRHALGSVMPLQLSLWLLPPFVLDYLAPK